jgi:hypothetical protein
MYWLQAPKPKAAKLPSSRLFGSVNRLFVCTETASCSVISMELAIPQSEAGVFALCDRALRLAPMELLAALPASKELLGAPEWYPFESQAWPLGEHIRLAFAKYRTLRTRSAFSRVVEVCLDRTLRRGRQSFVMALEFPQAREFASALLPLLSDSDVDGQVVGTLLKMRAYGYANQVQPLLQADKAWIRRLARRYIERSLPEPT